jgi:hypothetical protein
MDRAELLQKFLVVPKGMKRFRVIDKNTGMFLAKLPLSISIKEKPRKHKLSEVLII